MAVLKIAFGLVLVAAAVAIGGWNEWKQWKKTEQLAEAASVCEASYKLLAEQMHAEHAEIVRLLRDGASQRGQMAKQLDYVYNVVKSVHENPDFAKNGEN